VGVCAGVVGIEVGGEEYILDDTVRHWGCHQLLVVTLMGVRGKVVEVFVGGCFCCFCFLRFWFWRKWLIVPIPGRPV